MNTLAGSSSAKVRTWAKSNRPLSMQAWSRATDKRAVASRAASHLSVCKKSMVEQSKPAVGSGFWTYRQLRALTVDPAGILAVEPVDGLSFLPW